VRHPCPPSCLDTPDETGGARSRRAILQSDDHATLVSGVEPHHVRQSEYGVKEGSNEFEYEGFSKLNRILLQSCHDEKV
jgi:hypothetical protein